MKHVIIATLLSITIPCQSQDIPSNYWPKKVRTLEALTFNIAVPNGKVGRKVPANTEVEVVSFNPPEIKLKQGTAETLVDVNKTDFLQIAKTAFDSDLKNQAEQAEALVKEQTLRAEHLAKKKNEREIAFASISKLTNTDLQNAYYSARKAIQNTLKAPSTAKFSNPITDKETTGYSLDSLGRINCKGIVEASNSYGVPLRQSWSAVVQQEGSQQWRMVYAVLGENILIDTRKENPTNQERALSSFLGMTIQELKNEFGEPLEITEGNLFSVGKYKIYSFSKEKGRETFFTILESDEKVSSGLYLGADLPIR